jgi:hypothetical protein
MARFSKPKKKFRQWVISFGLHRYPPETTCGVPEQWGLNTSENPS